MDDSISRQAAINAFLTELTKRERKNLLHTWSTVEVKYFVADMLEKLPSAQPDVPDTYVGDMISRQAAIETVRKAQSIGQAHRMLVQLPPAQPECADCVKNGGDYECDHIHCHKGRPTQPGCEDAVPRTSVEYICRKNTVSTNPYEHKYHDKFIQFMNDPEISDFGRWEHSNGFNTALVAVQCDLDKVPSVTPKQPWWIPCSTALPEYDGEYLVTKKSFGWNCKEYIETDIARYEKKDGWHKADQVLAWQPLPTPYREGGQE